MTKKPNRTRPLDRDGDGKDGGSLPGNKTAPMAADTQVEGVEEITAEQLPISGSDLQGLDVDVVNAIAEANAPATQPADPVDDLADARTTPGDSPEKLEAIERETDEANAAAAAGAGNDDTADTYTFDAEQVEAAHENALHLSLGQVKQALDDTLTQYAWRLSELQMLADSKFLYKSAEGYSPTYAAPFISEEVAQQMIEVGLATFDEQAGNIGALRPTPQTKGDVAQITRNFDEAHEEEADA